MARAKLTINLAAVAHNWEKLNALSSVHVETGAVVKADAYGLGIGSIAPALHKAGARKFFVAIAEEAHELKNFLSEDSQIYVLSGYLPGDKDIFASNRIIPVLNSVEQFNHYLLDLPGQRYGIQIETGMHRLGIGLDTFAESKGKLLGNGICLIMSHLADADNTASEMNRRQQTVFSDETCGLDVPCSLAATGGILLGHEYHFDICRPGIGLFGGHPFKQAENVIDLEIPIIQIHTVLPGETVGYGCDWQAEKPTTVATILAGYADGIFRTLSNRSFAYANGVKCPIIGRVSMDLVTVDISKLNFIPNNVSLIGPDQHFDDLALQASTIGYEILTSLGQRYDRVYKT